MITGRQIKAARSLLDWDAEDLAKKADLSRDTIFNIENGKVQARGASAEKIVQAFASNGIEFMDFDGVRRRPENTLVYQGRDGLITLMEDIYDSCRRGIAGDIVLSGVSEDDFESHLGEYDATYLAKMSALPNLHMRCLIEEGDTNVVSSAYSEYRWSPRTQFKAVPFYVYADKLAIILFSSNPAPKIFVIQSIEVANAYRHQFESMWQNAKKISKGKIS